MSDFIKIQIAFAEKIKSAGDPKPPVSGTYFINKTCISILRSQEFGKFHILLDPAYINRLENSGLGTYGNNSVFAGAMLMATEEEFLKM